MSKPRPNPLLEAQQATHTTLTKLSGEAPGRDRPDFLYRNPVAISQRWAAACARIARIVEGAGASALFTRAVGNAAVPKLAHEYAELWAYFMTRHKAPPTKGTDHNPFRHLPDKDAARLFMRKVEDICDRSTRWLGGWYVK